MASAGPVRLSAQALSMTAQSPAFEHLTALSSDSAFSLLSLKVPGLKGWKCHMDWVPSRSSRLLRRLEADIDHYHYHYLWGVLRRRDVLRPTQKMSIHGV